MYQSYCYIPKTLKFNATSRIHLDLLSYKCHFRKGMIQFVDKRPVDGQPKTSTVMCRDERIPPTHAFFILDFIQLRLEPFNNLSI